MKTEMKTITPEIASKMLAGNRGNRRVRQEFVNHLAGAMRRGAFLSTHQGIAIAADGRLLDGQHRLMAVVKSGVTVSMLVASDVAEDVFRVLDTGIQRTLQDRFGGDKRVIEILSLAARLGGEGRRIDADQYEIYARSAIHEVAKRLIQHTGTVKKTFSSAGIRLAACLMVIDGGDENYVFGQYRAMVTFDYGSMSRATAEFHRRVASGKHITSFTTAQHQSMVTLAAGMKVFDVSRKDGALFRIMESELESLIVQAKTIIRAVI